MHLSNIREIENPTERLIAYEQFIRERKLNDTLDMRLSANIGFSFQEIESLVELLGKRCRQETKNKLKRNIFYSGNLSNHDIFKRVILRDDQAQYCAAQDYPAEIIRVRKLILKG